MNMRICIHIIITIINNLGASINIGDSTNMCASINVGTRNFATAADMEKVETMPDRIPTLTISKRDWDKIMNGVRHENMTMKMAVERYCKY